MNKIGKAIIIAAGTGSRLNHLTKHKPKCLLKLGDKTILEHQIDALKKAGIKKIALIKGYKKEKINHPELIYYINDNYQNNNILHSLFYAQKEMNEAFIASYSDIFYRQDIVMSLLKSQKDIAIIVDVGWQGYYKGRTDHPVEEAEKVIFDSNNKVVKIGKILSQEKSVSGEFIGLMKCSQKGARIFKNHFNRLKKIFPGKPFQTAVTFEKAYLTDMIQDLVDFGIPVECVTITSGWREIDTIQDYMKVLKEFKN